MSVIVKPVTSRGQGEGGEFLAAGLCWLHQRGVPVGNPPFYIAGCTKCEAKLAAGLVTADCEPPVRIGSWHARRTPSHSLAAMRDAAIRRSAMK